MNGPIVAGTLAQPFFNYNFGEGWYATTSPIITANWQVNGTKSTDRSDKPAPKSSNPTNA